MLKSRATRIVGIDYGLARLGVSISDERKIIATPFETLKNEKKLELTAASLVKALEADAKERHYTVSEIVLGLPLHMSGRSGVIADEVKAFAEALKPLISYPIVLWDERLTSVQAERSMIEANMNRRERAKRSDAVAAVIILQNYLDSKTFGEESVIPPL